MGSYIPEIRDRQNGGFGGGEWAGGGRDLGNQLFVNPKFNTMKKWKKWGICAGMTLMMMTNDHTLFAQGKGGNDGSGGLTTLEYDLADLNKADKSDKLDHNGKLVVKITNVNRLVYDVNVTGKSNAYNTEMPAMWSENRLKVEGEGELPQIPSDGTEVAKGSETDANAVIQQYSVLQKIKTDMASLQKLAVSPDLNGSTVKEKRKNWVASLGQDFNKKDTTALLTLYYNDQIEQWDTKLKTYNALADDEKGPMERAKIDLLAEKVKMTDYPALIADLLTLYDWLVPSSFTYESDPIYPGAKADEVEVNIAIQPRPGMEDPYLQPRSFSRTLPVRGGWKLDFSTGIAGISMPQKSYVMVAVPDTQLVTLEAEQANKLNFGLSALLHAHYRSASYLTGGISVGVAVGDDQNARYLLGGSIFIGREERFVGTLGLAFGKVDKLSNSQILSNQYPLGTSVEMVSRYAVGGFFGVSYNLGK